jgi:hypothetical protein
MGTQQNAVAPLAFNWVAGLWFLPLWSTKSGARRRVEASAPRRQPINPKFVY